MVEPGMAHFFILNIKHFEPCIHVLLVTVKLRIKFSSKSFSSGVSLEGWTEYCFDCTLMWYIWVWLYTHELVQEQFFFFLSLVGLFNKLKTKTQTWFIYKQININEIFIKTEVTYEHVHLPSKKSQ